MELHFRKWLTETATGTADVAGFSRPVMGVVRRSWLGPWGEEDPFFRRGKKKRLDEGVDHMGAKRRIPDGAIKVHLPGVQQTKSFSCGAAALQAIFSYYGVGPEVQNEFVDALGTNPDQGTKPDKIVKFAKKHGFQVLKKNMMSIEELKRHLDRRRPVIVAFQAWGAEQYYETAESGHYAVVIGYDEKNIYFEDPLIEAFRGYMPYAEFERRWHDKENEKKVYDHLGIVIWKPKTPHYLQRAVKIQ